MWNRFSCAYLLLYYSKQGMFLVCACTCTHFLFSFFFFWNKTLVCAKKAHISDRERKGRGEPRPLCRWLRGFRCEQSRIQRRRWHLGRNTVSPECASRITCSDRENLSTSVLCSGVRGTSSSSKSRNPGSWGWGSHAEAASLAPAPGPVPAFPAVSNLSCWHSSLRPQRWTRARCGCPSLEQLTWACHVPEQLL